MRERSDQWKQTTDQHNITHRRARKAQMRAPETDHCTRCSIREDLPGVEMDSCPVCNTAQGGDFALPLNHRGRITARLEPKANGSERRAGWAVDRGSEDATSVEARPVQADLPNDGELHMQRVEILVSVRDCLRKRDAAAPDRRVLIVLFFGKLDALEVV